jgi:cellulose 1,4-beta-cellobiosidase
MRSILILALLVAIVVGQQIGTNQGEIHPQLPIQQCSNSTGCKTLSTTVVLDSNWRWTHSVAGSTNCYTGNTWDKTLCPDPKTCATNCAIDGADYAGTYGITTSGNALTLKFVTHGPYSTNIGSRVYLMATDSQYQMFKLKNQEFTFDVDVSNLPCGLNGALYLVEMPADGGMAAYPTNKAGAKYGTGYCDAQCPHDMKWINGEANLLNWTPSLNDSNSGFGMYGTCCTEMDLWEANSMAAAYTPHLCSVSGQFRCSGKDCGDGPDRFNGVCDKNGCDMNSYRMGNKNFYGPSKTVDTSKVFTVVTQFVTNDGTANGDLVEIRRQWKQNGVMINNSVVAVAGMKPYNSISDAYCADESATFGDSDYFETKGGLKGLGASLNRGHVLSLSLWDDHTAMMLWLDSNYPPTSPTTTPGVVRGPCPITSGVPSDIENNYPGSSVIYSNIRFGDIGSTTK